MKGARHFHPAAPSTAASTMERVRRSGPRRSALGFTILELMLSIGIFAMILTAIYMTWISILKGSQAGLKAAAEVQRSRIAMRTIEDAFNGTEYFVANMKYYMFYADTSGDYATVSLATRVPDSFLGAQQTKLLNQRVRRVSFFTEPSEAGLRDLIMTEQSILAVTNSGDYFYKVRLAKDVTHFQLAFYDAQKGEWLDEWTQTNQLPKMVQIALGLGRRVGNTTKPDDVAYSLVALPSVGVGPDVQGTFPRNPVLPGQPPPPPLQ
jgi:type II secretory pathway pseudopilin PulG